MLVFNACVRVYVCVRACLFSPHHINWYHQHPTIGKSGFISVRFYVCFVKFPTHFCIHTWIAGTWIFGITYMTQRCDSCLGHTKIWDICLRKHPHKVIYVCDVTFAYEWHTASAWLASCISYFDMTHSCHFFSLFLSKHVDIFFIFHVYMCICVSVYLYVHAYACICVCVRIRTCICTCLLRKCVCMSTYM